MLRSDKVIGERVVQRFNDFTLYNDNHLVDTIDSNYPNFLFRVEQIDGRSLLLKAEGWSLSGWASADSVVPIEQAIDCFDIQVRDHPLDLFPRLMRAGIWADKKEFDKAIAEYTEAIRLDPESSYSYRGRGRTWSTNGEPEKAVADYTEAIRLDPESSCAYLGRGWTWGTSGESDKAIADYTEAIRLDPKCSYAYAGRGLAWCAKSDFGKALADLSDSISMNSDCALAYLGRGLTWKLKGEYDKAVADLTEAIRLDPDCHRVYYFRGLARSEKKEFDDAIADFTEAVRLDPEFSVDAYVDRGIAWCGKKEFEKAFADYNVAIQLDPTNARAYENRRWAWVINPGFRTGIFFAGAEIGALAGLVPLFLGVRDDETWLAVGGFPASIVCGLAVGIIGAAIIVVNLPLLVCAWDEPATGALQAPLSSSKTRNARGRFLFGIFFHQSLLLAWCWSFLISFWMRKSVEGILVLPGASYGLSMGLGMTVFVAVYLRRTWPGRGHGKKPARKSDEIGEGFF